MAQSDPFKMKLADLVEDTRGRVEVLERNLKSLHYRLPFEAMLVQRDWKPVKENIEALIERTGFGSSADETEGY